MIMLYEVQFGKDGKVYETLFHWAKDVNPVNDPAF